MQIADAINSSLDELFPSPEIRMIAEPGTYFSASAFHLAVNVISRRMKIDDKGIGINHWLFFNEMVMNSIKWKFKINIYTRKNKQVSQYQQMFLRSLHTEFHFFGFENS